ncbi:MAG: universal stress protein [Gammaproteobacteria bacterium]|jgi:nucleotide-binding universal stress UspA family protein
MYQTILLAYDGTTYSEHVLQRGAELARLCQARLHLLSIVVTTGNMAIAEAVGATDVWGIEQKSLEKIVDEALQNLQAQGLQVSACVRSGEPDSEIVRYAREIQADLVILGHTSKGMLSRWLQGSLCAKLLDQLPCNLLVVAGDAP